jgi:hypothetical protein
MNEIEIRVKDVVKEVIEKMPDGWEKHNALCKLQEAIWWILKGMIEVKK